MFIRFEIYEARTFAAAATFKTERRPTIGEEVDIDFDDAEIEFAPGLWVTRPKGLWVLDVHDAEGPIGRHANGELFVVRHHLTSED